ncbi:LolA family protein [Arachidicoccus sp.]|jgi:outer membrane lipoprotein-sorting protein|uniref:LolA family protein n=1 Tax=Arachidicoccus sp. TaxID=1872624 RepID=UPI003D239DA9
MKKFFVTLLSFSFLAVSGFAQSNAKEILNKVSNNLKGIKGATADFTYSTKDRNNHNLGTINGKIALKGNKYFIKQSDNEIYCNGQKVWNYNGSDEVTVSDVDNSTGTLSPQKLLAGNFVDKDFTSKMISSNGSFYVIELIPTDPRKNFKKVDLYVNKSKDFITKATVWEKAGNTVNFNMSNVNTHASLPDSKFVFDTKAHPGVDVIN